MARSKLSISSTQVVPNLIQGVSQQSPQQRRDAQCEDQKDCWNSVLEGAGARPHFDLVKAYPDLYLGDSLFSETSYESESYLTGVRADGTPFAIDLADGTLCTVTNTVGDVDYLILGPGNSKTKLRAQVVDEYTFLVNRNISVLMDTTTSPTLPNEALAFIRATNFNTTYAIALSGTGGALAVSYATDPELVTPTSTIAENLKNFINADVAAGYTAVRYGSSIHIYRADGVDFTVTSQDGNGDDYMRVFKGVCPSFERLPVKAPTGFILKVSGERRSGDDDYYVKFVGDPDTGVWQETLGPNVKVSLNAGTMPHAIVNTGYRTFEYRRNVWSSRVAGDDDSAKVPAFVGKPLRDLTYYDRRLGAVWRGGTVFSKAKAPFTFFVDTVQTVLATAPVDIEAVSGTKKGSPVLDFAVLVAEGLFVWAQKSQFRIDSGQDPFKQDTVQTKASSAYEYSPNSYPLDLGSFVFMPTDIGPWASLRAILYQNGRVTGDVDVSSHVSKLIPAPVASLTGSDTLRCVVARNERVTNELSVFNYTWDGQQFIQSAFNTWRLPGGDILWASIDQNILRVIQQRPEGAVLLQANLTPRVVDPVAGAAYSTRLDLRVPKSAVVGLSYNGTTQTTSFTLPYTPSGADLLVVQSEDGGGYSRGREHAVVSVVGDVVTVTGDLSAVNFYVGHRITSYRAESEFFIRGEKGAEPTDRLTVNRVKLTYSDTGYTRIEVNIKPDKMKTTQTEVTQLGVPAIRTGALDAPVSALSNEVTIKLVNDSFLPSYWQNLSYDFDAVGWQGAK